MLQSETQWEYLGDCEFCGAACYSDGERFKSTSNLPGCRCHVKGYGDEEEDE